MDAGDAFIAHLFEGALDGFPCGSTTAFLGVMMIFAFMLALRNFAENGPSKRVKKVCAQRAKEERVGNSDWIRPRSRPRPRIDNYAGDDHRACWSSSFSLLRKQVEA